MSVIDGVLLALLFISALLAAVLILIKLNMLKLNKPEQVNVFNNLLIIIVLIFFIALGAKLLMSDEGKKWLDSFSENGDCDRIDRPYWCEL